LLTHIVGTIYSIVENMYIYDKILLLLPTIEKIVTDTKNGPPYHAFAHLQMNICVYDLLSWKTTNIVILQKWLVWTLITNTLIVMDMISSSETLIALKCFSLFFNPQLWATHRIWQQFSRKKHIGKKNTKLQMKCERLN